MPDQLRLALSFLIHAFVGLVLSVLIAHGVDIPAQWSAIAETALLAVVVAAYAALTHWLAARRGSAFWPSAARWAAKVLTLGTGALVPVAAIAPAPAPAAPQDAKAAQPPAA